MLTGFVPAVAIVPLVLISSLRLGRTEKTGILFVFGIGSISIIASVARLVVITIRIAAHRMDWDSTHVSWFDSRRLWTAG